MESYNEKIASNKNAELILFSWESEAAAADWAQKVQMPWPTMLQDDIDEEEISELYFSDRKLSFPTYLLVDNTGKLIVTGKASAFAKIAQ